MQGQAGIPDKLTHVWSRTLRVLPWPGPATRGSCRCLQSSLGGAARQLRPWPEPPSGPVCLPELAWPVPSRRGGAAVPFAPLWALVCVLIAVETGAHHLERLCAALQAGPRAPCPLEQRSVTAGVCRPCLEVEALPQGPRCKLRAPRSWASGTVWGGRLPTQGTRAFWQQSRDAVPGDPSWRTGSHVDTGSTHFFRGCRGGVGGIFSLCRPHPRRGSVGRLGGEGGRLCPPAGSWARRRLFPGAPAPRPGLLLGAGFLVSVCCRRGCSQVGVPTPSASFLLPRLSLPPGRAWPRPVKGHWFRGPGGSSTALCGCRLCLQATPLWPVSGRLSVTQPRPSRWAKLQRGAGDVDGTRAIGPWTGLGRWGSGRPWV